MESATARQTTELAELERHYRQAWEALAQQVTIWSSLISNPGQNRGAIEEACHELKLLEDRYRQARDRLADYMLATLEHGKRPVEKSASEVPARPPMPEPAAKIWRSEISIISPCGCC
jgi:hypothetical protein